MNLNPHFGPLPGSIGEIAGQVDDMHKIKRMVHQCYRHMRDAVDDTDATWTAYRLYEQLTGTLDRELVTHMLIDVWLPYASGTNVNRVSTPEGYADLRRTEIID